MDVVTVKGFRVSPAKEADRAVLLRPAPRPQGREIGLLALSLVLVTLLHYGVEAALEATLGQNAEDVGHLAVVLYLVPLAWASVMFGPRQLLLIGLAVFAVNVPSLVLHHLRGLSWLFEATLLGTLLLVAAVLAWRNRAAAQEREDGLRLVVQRVTAAQEEERRRIAQELHDDTMQGLVIVRRELESLLGEPELHGSFRQKVEELEEATKRLADGLRRFSRDLRPSILDDLGLIPAIEWVVEDLHHRTGLLVHTSVLGEARRLTPDQEVALFRIAQEALRNIEKHAQARQVQVEIAYSPESTRLCVQDDGVGFSMPASLNDLVQAGKLGLLGLGERSALIGGKLEITSAPGKGTTVCVEVPKRLT